MRLSFCSANVRNTSPTCFLNSPYSALRRHLGMNTTWYLHSHFVWLRLSILSIVEIPSRVLGGSRRESLRWTPVAVKPLLPPRQSLAEPEGLLHVLELPARLNPRVRADHQNSCKTPSKKAEVRIVPADSNTPFHVFSLFSARPAPSGIAAHFCTWAKPKYDAVSSPPNNCLPSSSLKGFRRTTICIYEKFPLIKTFYEHFPMSTSYEIISYNQSAAECAF